MPEVMVTTDGFVIDAELVGSALGIDAVSVPGRMRTGEITSRCETGIDQDAGRFRLTLFCDGRALRLTVDGEGKILSRSTFPARRGVGQISRARHGPIGPGKGV